MNIAQFIKSERQHKSPCCDWRIQIVYQSTNSTRTAAVYVCLKCDRLHIVDSRDDTPGNTA